jgi:MraZ protein
VGHDQTGSALLLGEFEQRLDDKNRVTLPARLRVQFEGGLVCARGLDGCINVWPLASWEAYVTAQSDRLDSFSREGRALERYLFGGALECELDRQGRVALPAPLVGHASLDKDIVIAGLRDRLEIWDRESWRRQLANVEGSAEVVAERIANSRA